MLHPVFINYKDNYKIVNHPIINCSQGKGEMETYWLQSSDEKSNREDRATEDFDCI